MSMDRRLIEFAALLRRNGIRVSTAETLDAFQAIDLSGVVDRGTFRSALGATMIKRTPDLETFYELFDRYFSGIGDLVREAGQAGAGAMSDEDMADLLERLQSLLDGLDPGASDLAQALMMQDSGALEKALRELMESGQLPNMQGNYVPTGMTEQLLQMVGAGGLQDEMARLRQAAQESGMSEEDMDRLGEYMDQRGKDLADMLKSLLRLEHEQTDRKEDREQERERLLDKSFYYLSPTEIKRMREAVAALARRLKNIMALRFKRRRRGRLDVKATLRDSMEFGGVPFRIRYENRRKERPQVVILCDVSDSVRNVSRFMLQFVHSLQDLYSRVRSYVFVADLVEVTKLFKDNEIQSAIQKAINGDVVNVYAHSDFGKAFQQFHRDHLSVIDSRTTVIVLGDARNNYNAAQDWVLRDVQERARQVIWLNPENRSTWGFGDSEMSLYGKHCDIVEECRNLRQLYGVVDSIVVG